MASQELDLPDDVCREVCESVDLARPELGEIRRLHEQGDHRAAALAFVRHLRGRPTPQLEHPRHYIDRLRARATAEQRQRARERLVKALAGDLVTDSHRDPVTAAGADTFYLGADEALCDAIGDKILAARDQWGGGPWGTTRGIVEMIARMLLLPECPDRSVVAPLGWLGRQVAAEWAWARTWDDGMLGTSGHNWYLHTYLGFYEAGLWLGELKGLAQFATLGPTYFQRELALLMASDGFTNERSGYHYGTVRLFLDAARVARANGAAMGEAFDCHLRRVVATLWKVVGPDGCVPWVGDCGATRRPDTNLIALRRAAVELDMPEAKFVAEALAPNWQPGPDEMFADGDGDDLLPAYRAAPMAEPEAPTADTVLPASGYYFLRQDWTPRADWMCIEAGPLGNIVNSHDHTHVFNFELYSRGRPVLIDNGSGPYGDYPARLWRVGSSAHNVLTVDGADHIPVQDEWRWGGVVRPTVAAWRAEPRFAYFSGAHEGYRYLPEPVESHRRKVFYLRGEYWILIDRVVPGMGDAEHDYQLHFHVGVPSRLGDDGRLVTEGEGGNLLIVPVEGARGAAAVEPCPFPLDGYDNPEHLTYTRRAAGRGVFVTLLAGFEGDRVPDVAVRLLDIEADGRTLDVWEATALEIVIDGRRDVYYDQHMHWNLPWRAGGCEGAGRLFHSRCT